MPYIIAKGSTEGRERAKAMIDALNPAHPWAVTIKRHRKKRTNPQNNYLWGVVYKTIAEETGHSAAELHEILLGLCFGTEVVEILGVKKRRPVRRSSDMTTEELSAYAEWISAWAASELGCIIPLPGEIIT